MEFGASSTGLEYRFFMVDLQVLTYTCMEGCLTKMDRHFVKSWEIRAYELTTTTYLEHETTTLTPKYFYPYVAKCTSTSGYIKHSCMCCTALVY